MNGISWYLQFEPAQHLRDLPRSERFSAARAYFRECMSRVAPHMEGLTVLQSNDLMLGVAFEGSENQCQKLSEFVVREHLGHIVQNVRVGVAMDIEQGD